ncbi:MAG: c-type cytochrome [Bacteroidetes bacterium]|nr:MAG: c-type cytochrome [Bacteroidota bacterium]
MNNVMKSTLKNISAALLFGLTSLTLTAQDGAALFKAKCNTCHMLEKNSTGPNLKGVKQKWTDAGEGELIYEWVKNPQNLIATGKSQMANEIKSFSPTDMTPQQVSNEEIDAILNYVDTYTPVAETTPSGDVVTDPENVVYVPNYQENLTLFYWLLASIIVLLIAIIVMSTTISGLVNSDYFKKKLAERNNSGNGAMNTIIILIASILFIASQNGAYAFTYNGPGEAAEGMPWLIIENSDLYVMVVIDLILISVLLYLRRMFREFLSMVRTEKQVAEAAAVNVKKINQILTDVVPIEEEHTILMQHEYDGIRELDNNLPPWWLWGFYGTIIFSLVYIVNYHVLGTSDLQYKAYEKEMVQAKKDVDEYLSKMAMNVDETNATLMTEEKDLSAGKALFETNCVACHNPKGEGNIGPNLTDKHWIYGPDVKDLFKTIKYGTPNGMPEHASKLNPVQLQQVSSFVLSLPYAAGKEPEGKEYK